ncbi:MAG: hypothetical protein MUE68_11810 [Bacteroidetes bacterium]|jgi:hypothetical protein|nr:hypothetical protein [Bacteroidota bacterium]
MRRSRHSRSPASPRLRGLLNLLLFVSLAGSAVAQPAAFPFILRATATSGAKVFPNPTSPSSTIRNTSVPVSGWYGGAAEILIPFTSELSVTANVEYLRSIDEGLRPISLGGALETVPVRDGYVVVPVEAGIAVSIPVSDEVYRLLMSGGFGVTFVSRIQEVAGVSARTEGLPAAYGIFVGVAFEAKIWPGVYGHLSTRFRDPEANVTTRYPQPTAFYQGRTLLLPSEPTTTRLNLDGLSISAGVMVDLERLF